MVLAVELEGNFWNPSLIILFFYKNGEYLYNDGFLKTCHNSEKCFCSFLFIFFFIISLANLLFKSFSRHYITTSFVPVLYNFIPLFYALYSQILCNSINPFFSGSATHSFTQRFPLKPAICGSFPSLFRICSQNMHRGVFTE